MDVSPSLNNGQYFTNLISSFTTLSIFYWSILKGILGIIYFYLLMLQHTLLTKKSRFKKSQPTWKSLFVNAKSNSLLIYLINIYKFLLYARSYFGSAIIVLNKDLHTRKQITNKMISESDKQNEEIRQSNRQ